MHSDLIERLEALSGPDREVDCLIAIAAGWDVEMPFKPLGELVKAFGEPWLFEASTEYNSIYKTLPHYTASIDAAMTLVPEGWYWNIKHYRPTINTADVGGIWEGKGPTPAIALCIASLRARSADNG